MNPDRWRRVEALFHGAVELDPPARAVFLDRECGADGELRGALERLLRDDATADPVLDGDGPLPAPPPADALLGRVVGRYRLKQMIGAGGMGVVYAAERADGLFEQEVAVKLVRGILQVEDLHRRFDRERRALAALNHPHIARLYDGGTTDEGIPYLAMELVRGEPIDRWCDERSLSVERRLRLFVEVARAVHFAHTHLVVHRDLKPSNVLVDADGQPKLLDFGIARLLDHEADREPQTLTQIMTPEYASPEQLAGGAVTTATDVYSLGVVLYILLTGRRPYHCTSLSPVAWQRMVAERTPTRPSAAVARAGAEPAPPDAPPPPAPREVAARFGTTPARLRRRLAGDLDRIVLMALRKEPERRYGSAQELADDVERHLAGLPVRARQDSLGYRLARFAQRHRVAVLAGCAVLLALVAGSVAALRGERRARREALLAAEQAEHARIEAESFRGIARFLEDQVLALLDPSAAGDSERARAAEAMLLRQAEQVRHQYPDEVHLRANMLDALGRVALRFDLHETAVRLIDEAFALREAQFGAQSLEVALSLESRGLLLYATGEFAAAEPVLRRRLELHRTLPLGTHTDVAGAANDLAAILRNLGQLDEAQRLHEEALARRRAAGPGSLPVAESLNNLAGVALDRGRPAEAVTLMTEALEIRRAILGDAHGLTIQALANLATACGRGGDQDQARRRFEEAERGARELGAAGADPLARILSSLAALDISDGSTGAAAARLDEALAIQRARLPAGHPVITALLERLAALQVEQGELQAADATWREVLAARRATLSPTHPTLARSLREHALFLADTQRLEEARAELEQALGILRAAGIPDPAELGRTEVGLATVLGLLDRRDEGLEHARAGLELLEGSAGAWPGEVERAREALSTLRGDG